MTCWKTINITKEVGQNRLIMLSVFTGIVAFIVFYIPFSMIFQPIDLIEPPLFGVLISLFLLPLMHKLMHVGPLLFTDKEIRLQWNTKYRFILTLKIELNSTLSKKTSVLSMLAPSIVITIPLIITAFFIPEYYPILLMLASVHIGISLHDWLTLISLVYAPKKSIIEKSENEFDILVHKR